LFTLGLFQHDDDDDDADDDIDAATQMHCGCLEPCGHDTISSLKH